MRSCVKIYIRLELGEEKGLFHLSVHVTSFETSDPSKREWGQKKFQSGLTVIHADSSCKLNACSWFGWVGISFEPEKLGGNRQPILNGYIGTHNLLPTHGHIVTTHGPQTREPTHRTTREKDETSQGSHMVKITYYLKRPG